MPYVKETERQHPTVAQPMFITVSNSGINHVNIRMKTATWLLIGFEDSDDGTLHLRGVAHRWGKLNVQMLLLNRMLLL
jgi:hypothetical protein